MRFILRPNDDLEGYDIIDLGQSCNEHDENDERVIVATAYDHTDAKMIAELLEQILKDN